MPILIRGSGGADSALDTHELVGYTEYYSEFDDFFEYYNYNSERKLYIRPKEILDVYSAHRITGICNVSVYIEMDDGSKGYDVFSISYRDSNSAYFTSISWNGYTDPQYGDVTYTHREIIDLIYNRDTHEITLDIPNDIAIRGTPIAVKASVTRHID